MGLDTPIGLLTLGLGEDNVGAGEEHGRGTALEEYTTASENQDAEVGR